MYPALPEDQINDEYVKATEIYSAFGVDTDQAVEKLKDIPVSIHCWQGDDCAGFEGESGITGGGILATGNYPGRARNGDELRQDFETAVTMIPGKKRFNLHAMYLETEGRPVARDEIEPGHFSRWIDWAKKLNLGLDFNPTYFSHPNAASGFTLSSKDKAIRDFWIRHTIRCREIAFAMGKELGTTCINNLWLPDGSKDYPADRYGHRMILKEALDKVFEKKLDPACTLDAVESKLFGLASEAYVVGSHEFYLGYALTRSVILTMDAGHYHPTEDLSDKLSALLPFCDRLLLHVSRPMRWDSDHVVLFDDATRAIAREIKRADAFQRISIALDFFDASINRITAWVTGTRATQKALLLALLEPTDLLIAEEEKGNMGNRLALMEEFKTLPFVPVWNYYCMKEGVVSGASWIDTVGEYEEKVLKNRS